MFGGRANRGGRIHALWGSLGRLGAGESGVDIAVGGILNGSAEAAALASLAPPKRLPLGDGRPPKLLP